MTLLIAFACGALFAIGLIVSQMVNPAKVLGFLDLSEAWDPTLALVFIGGLAVAVPGIQMVLKRGKPLVAKSLSLPDSSSIDPPLIGGAALFGIGWGLAGLCPGPAVTALASGETGVFIFFIAMIAGMAAYKAIASLRSSGPDG